VVGLIFARGRARIIGLKKKYLKLCIPASNVSFFSDARSNPGKVADESADRGAMRLSMDSTCVGKVKESFIDNGQICAYECGDTLVFEYMTSLSHNL
jgi:hypothetical protein